ncbi:MAG: hypothetical protein M3N52_11255 [Actinomycetota bacterium]|nr:hypothetical protein [Actinomycetota bacterium]
MSGAGSTAARSRPFGTAALDKANLTQRAASRFYADAQGLAATFVWDSGDGPGPYDAVVRVSGRRHGVVGPRSRNDDFVREEHVRGIIPGSGPVSLTTQVHHISRRVVGDGRAHEGVGTQARGRSGEAGQEGDRAASAEPGQVVMAPVDGRPAAPTAIRTRWAPLTGLDSAPAVLPGSYVALIAAGVVLGLLLQLRLVAAGGVETHPSSSGRCWRSQPASSVRSCGTASTAQVVSVHQALSAGAFRDSSPALRSPWR